MAMTDMTIVRRSMRSRLFSTVTTVVTVAIAVALLLILLTMRTSAQNAFERGSGNMHFVLSAEPDPLTVVLNNIFYVRPPRNAIAIREFERIIEGVPVSQGARASAQLQDGFAIPIQHGDSFRGYPVMATTRAFFDSFMPVPQRPWVFAQGNAFRQDFEVVLGAGAARGTGLRVDDEISLTHGTGAAGGHVHDEHRFRVVGVLEPTGTSHDRGIFTSLQSAWIIHAQDRLEVEHAAGEDHDHDHEHADEHTATASDLTDEDRKITGAYVRLVTRKGSETSAAMQSVFSMLRAERGITIAQPADEIRRLFGIVSNVEQILVAIAAVVMVSSGIAIMLALYNSMEQRRRQIAVLRVLGASRGRIFGLVLTESALLGLLGAAAGVVLALAGGVVVAFLARDRLGLVIEPWPELKPAIAVGLSAVVLAGVAGLIPAVMAYRTSVARNLKPIG